MSNIRKISTISTSKIIIKKAVILSCFVLSFAVLAGCGTEKQNAIDIDPNMQAFLDNFDGTSNSIKSALKKHGATLEMSEDEITMYDLASPIITAKTWSCYTLDAEAWVTTRTYDICREEWKINKIEFKEMK